MGLPCVRRRSWWRVCVCLLCVLCMPLLGVKVLPVGVIHFKAQSCRGKEPREREIRDQERERKGAMHVWCVFHARERESPMCFCVCVRCAVCLGVNGVLGGVGVCCEREKFCMCAWSRFGDGGDGGSVVELQR
ncbi:unnamed protein product [Camellia sinensis]